MRTRSARRWVALLLLLASGVAPATAEPDLDAMGGRWRLDWERSDPSDALMEALEVGWVLRQLAGVATVELTVKPLERACASCPERFEFTVHSPLSDRKSLAILDDEARPGVDPQGTPTVDRYRRSQNGIERTRVLTLPSGKAATLVENRAVVGATLQSNLAVSIDGAERTRVKRVFTRVAP